jgi:hypothetical protein
MPFFVRADEEHELVDLSSCHVETVATFKLKSYI